LACWGLGQLAHYPLVSRGSCRADLSSCWRAPNKTPAAVSNSRLAPGSREAGAGIGVGLARQSEQVAWPQTAGWYRPCESAQAAISSRALMLSVCLSCSSLARPPAAFHALKEPAVVSGAGTASPRSYPHSARAVFRPVPARASSTFVEVVGHSAPGGPTALNAYLRQRGQFAGL
jgi:hypothetical protein